MFLELYSNSDLLSLPAQCSIQSVCTVYFATPTLPTTELSRKARLLYTTWEVEDTVWGPRLSVTGSTPGDSPSLRLAVLITNSEYVLAFPSEC